MLTPQQIHELADLAVACRPHGAPHWDRPGIAAALRQVRHIGLGEVMRAVVIAAEDGSLRTPAAIGDLDSHVWRTVQTPSTSVRARPADPGRLCSTCSLPETECRRRWADDHEYLSADDHRAQVEAMDPLVRALRMRDLRAMVRSFGEIPDA